MSVSGVHHVGLSVGDLDAAEAWYGHALGFEPEFRAAFGPLRVTMGKLPGGTRLELLEHGESVAGAQGLAPNDALLTRGWAHIALDVEDLDGVYARLLAAGAGAVWPPRQSPEPGVSMAFVRDPEGNLIELISKDGGR
ncbi:MAG TPA: VOC family protein [Solirubrobacteraceae bacterium]|jgi:catechol 2,3-dioxygenase-like lactoylglutathione lyase family enzyme|nr:VOC family protein [Solirubrobacteraceae bacterium]